VSYWLRRKLTAAVSTHIGVTIVLDPDGIVDLAELPGDVAEVHDWWWLRAAYERRGRRRLASAGRFTIVVRGRLATEPLPWDIERVSAATVHVRLPGPPPVRAILAELDGEEAERAIRAAEGAADSAAAVIGCLGGVAVTAGPLSRADQLRLASRLAVREPRSPALLALARRWVVDPMLARLLDEPSDVRALQDEWARFALQGKSSWAGDFYAARVELGQLFGAGALKSVIASSNVPPWATVGVRVPTNAERAEDLLTERPTPFPPTDAAGWIAVAEWWGNIRRLVAAGPSDLRQRAWHTWADVDAAFQPWLQERYGTILSSAALWPPAVHRVAHFLARRVREHDASRIMLIVLDGLGHAQWAYLREELSLQVMEAGSTFALVPTYTTVSRQAIFAADLPVTYPDALWASDLSRREKRHWQALWAGEGLPVASVAYFRVKGSFPHDHIDFGAARAIGVVVNAVDDLMHTSELFGDAQLLANLDVWAANGFLVDLIHRANAAGIEIWITADHGNLECLPAGLPSEGVAIESAGKRLLRYPNRLLRDSSAAEGIVWDKIPGMPASTDPMIFAPGRLAFTNHRLSVSHGGLSIDEVVVPLARVSA